MALYFDHNACTPVDPRVLDRFLAVERAHPGNAGSLHTAGRRARGAVEAAREAVACRLGVAAEHVFFVSGGTEANNQVIAGHGDPALPVLLAPVEHPSVTEAAEQRGACWWEVDADGRAAVADPARPIGLLTLVHAQNETGTLQPIGAAAEVAARHGVPFHVDASQTLGRCPLDEVIGAATSITLSTHKAGGLRGCAVLIDTLPQAAPLLRGGGQQRGRRPGTEAVGLIAATAYALELAVLETALRARCMRAAADAFRAGLGPAHGTCLSPVDALPNTVMFEFRDVEGRMLLPALDIAGVEASQGSACSAGAPTPPAILTAMGLDPARARRCVRFSFSHTTTPAQASEGAHRVAGIVERLQSGRAAPAPERRT